MARLDRLATLLDSQFRIPGTGWRVGLDGLIGLIPGVGDLAGGALSLYLMLEARRLGAGTATMLHMLWNVLLDLLLGAIPLLGDLFDFVFKVNQRNLALLQKQLRQTADSSGD